MSLQTCAAAALNVFPDVAVATPRGTYRLPAVMLAIGGAENPGWGNAPGDSLSIYRDGGVSERPYSCGGKTSFGTWQINLPAHSAMVASLSGIPASDPCGQATWLADYLNCAKAALAVYRSQGLGAWTTWQDGAYLQYLGTAASAIAAAAAAATPTPSPTPSPAPTPGTPAVNPWLAGLAVLGIVAVAGAGGWYVSRLPQRRAKG